MKIAADINDNGDVTLTKVTLSSSTTFNVPAASGLANQLEAVLAPGEYDHDDGGYVINKTPDGVTVSAYVGKLTVRGSGHRSTFDIPWDHITSVVSQLRA